MPPRKWPQAKPEPEEPKLVANSDEMLAQHFQRHCQTRHRQTLRFRSRNEHNQDHRLHQELLDHIHPNTRPEPEPTEGEGGNAEASQG
jgi:hypothetical protein